MRDAAGLNWATGSGLAPFPLTPSPRRRPGHRTASLRVCDLILAAQARLEELPLQKMAIAGGVRHLDSHGFGTTERKDSTVAPRLLLAAPVFLALAIPQQLCAAPLHSISPGPEA